MIKRLIYFSENILQTSITTLVAKFWSIQSGLGKAGLDWQRLTGRRVGMVGAG